MRYLTSILTIACTIVLSAQDKMDKIQDNSRKIVVDKTVVTTHQAIIKGKSVAFLATTGTQPVWNSDGETVAAVHYTYYERTDTKK